MIHSIILIGIVGLLLYGAGMLVFKGTRTYRDLRARYKEIQRIHLTEPMAKNPQAVIAKQNKLFLQNWDQGII